MIARTHDKDGNPLTHLGNLVLSDSDGLRGTVKYRIVAKYDRMLPDGFADIWHDTIDEFELTWGQIREDGGVAAVMQDIRECYAPVVDF